MTVSIKNYFKPVNSVKRGLEVENQSQSIDSTSDAKKQRKEEPVSHEKTLIQNTTSKTNSDTSDYMSHELTYLEKSWFEALENELKKPYFKKIKEFLEKERAKGVTIYPPANVKCVILGQDPYHNVGQAHGLCFSVPLSIRPPPSLLNIYKELVEDIPGFVKPNHGNLEKWAGQGVLLLNTTLTVKAHNAASHAKIGWEKFTDSIVDILNRKKINLVFILWGNHAQRKGCKIDRNKHLVLEAKHPSPLSAHRGFFGCKHFSQANDYLRANNIAEIDWNL